MVFTKSERDIGPCMDIASSGKALYAIQNSEQHPGGRICKIDTDGNILCEYGGIGNARQIGIQGGLVAVTAREDGLWLFSADTLTLICHYPTVEYATGSTLYANYAFISCRQYGIEIVDISNPKKPVHVGLIRIGEVQSACVWNGYLFGGVWGEMNVAVVDIRDLSNPKLVTRIHLQGRGDGVVVKDGILYAAIGQHRRGIKNISDEYDPCFGNGNGFEVFDVTDIRHVRKIHTEFTGKRYSPYFDTWRPYLCGELLLVTNSTLGLYVYSAKEHKLLDHVDFPDVNGRPDAVTGAAVCEGKLFIATGRGGLYFLKDRTVPPTYRYDVDAVFRVPPHFFRCDSKQIVRVFHSDEYPILDVCGCSQGLALACADAGIQLFQNGKIVSEIPTDGFCCSVKSFDHYLFSAESSGGLSIYRLEDGKATQISNLKPGFPILQLCLNKKGTCLLFGCGSKTVYAADVSDKTHPKILASRSAAFGPLYGENFASAELSDGTMVMFWHRDGLVTFQPEKCPSFDSIFYKRHSFFMNFGPENGIDTDGENIYYNLDGGYVLLPRQENVYADDLPRVIPSVPIRGKFIIYKNQIIACERALGEITLTDIADRKHPKSILKIQTNVSPAKPVVIRDQIFIPAGFGGLLRLDP